MRRRKSPALSHAEAAGGNESTSGPDVTTGARGLPHADSAPESVREPSDAVVGGALNEAREPSAEHRAMESTELTTAVPPVDTPASAEQAAPADAEAGAGLTAARAAAARGDTAQAVAQYRELLLDEDTLVVRLELGQVYDERGDHVLAVEQYEAACALDEDNVDALLGLGGSLAALSRFDAAERELRRALRLDATRSAVYATMGMVNFRRGLYTQAEQELKRAIELDAVPSNAYFYRGEALNQLNRVEEAIEMIERAIQLQPANARAYYVMGILYDKKGRPQEAAGMYRKAREVAAA